MFLVDTVLGVMLLTLGFPWLVQNWHRNTCIRRLVCEVAEPLALRFSHSLALSLSSLSASFSLCSTSREQFPQCRQTAKTCLEGMFSDFSTYCATWQGSPCCLMTASATPWVPGNVNPDRFLKILSPKPQTRQAHLAA